MFEKWQKLFNGRDLKDWTPKIVGSPAGVNFGETFRVENGMISVRYDQYGGKFNERFGHLFYKTQFSHYRTHAGAEVDLVLETSGGDVTAIEIKRTLSPKLTPGFIESMETLGASRGYYLIPEGDSFPLSASVEAQSLAQFLASLIK